MMRVPDPLDGYAEPRNSGRCTKPCCECEDGDPKLCWVCEAEWDAMFSDAEIHPEPEVDSNTDPWLDEVRDPTVDDELWDRAAALEEYPDD